MKVVCLECGTDCDVKEGETLCPTCKTPLSQFVNVASTAGFQRGAENVTPMTDGGGGKTTEMRVPEKVGRYVILGRAGAGGMGVVYKARDPELDRIVALKVMIAGEHATADTIQRFQREAKAAAKLSHPNIVHVYEVGVDPSGLYYFAMEFVDGAALDRLVKDSGFDAAGAARIARDLARALQYAHEQGVIHRDLKPANVMIDRGGAPRLTDFGLAKAMGDEQSLTRAGEILGTACYMPPEQASGMTGVDQRSDIYSMGAILYEMLTRRPPFVGETVVAILRKVEDEDPVLPSEIGLRVPRDLETICFKAMAKEKDRRYASAAEMAEDLDRFLQGMPIAAQRSSILYRSTKWARRHPAAFTAVLMTLAGALIVGALLARPATPPVVPIPPDPGPDKHALLKQAEPFYRSALADVEKARRFIRPGDRRTRQEVYRRAQASLDKAVEKFREYADAYHLRGLVDLRLNQPVRAMDDFNHALKCDPTITDAYFERVQLRLREVDDKILRGVPFVDPSTASDMFSAEKKLILEDIAAIRKTGQKPERAFVAEAGLIKAFRDSGDPIALLDEALKLDPTLADALVLRASLVMAKGGKERLEAALEDLNAAIRYDANNQGAFKTRAGVHLALNQADQALKDLDEMVAIAPDEGQSYLDRAIVLGNWSGSKRRQMREDLQMAVKLDPRNPTARFLEGVDRLRQPGVLTAETVKQCRLAFEIAIAEDPSFVPAYAFRLICDNVLFDEAFQKHLDEFNKAFAHVSEQQRSGVQLAVGHIATSLRERMQTPATRGMFDAACEDLKDGEYADAEAVFRDVLRRLDDPLIMSREGLDVRRQRELRSKTHYNLGCLHALRKEADPALASLESAFRLDPDLAKHADEDPDLEGLRDDPRLAALMKRFGKE